MALSVLRYWHPVLRADALRSKPVGVTVAGRRIALFRSGGRLAALDDLCPHRKASLSGAGRVQGDKLVCGYHGWSFDAQGCGQSLSQPGLAKCDTTAFQVVERHGYLWVAERGVSESTLPQLGWDGFALVGAFDVQFDCPLATALDNFSEDEHFPAVHTLLGWNGGGVNGMEFSADNFDDRSEVRYTGPQRRHPMLPLFGVKPGDRYFNEWVTRFDPVHAVFAFRWEDPRTGKPRPLQVRTGVFLVPEEAQRTRLHVFPFVRAEPGSLHSFIKPVVRQAALFIGRREIEADARICRHVHTPASLEGLRLGKYDKPVIHNRKLLKSLYFGEERLSVVPNLRA